MSSNLAEFENLMSLENPVKSSVLPRWQRKQMQSQMLSDRFIPLRQTGGASGGEASGSSYDMDLTTNLANSVGEDSDYSRAIKASGGNDLFQGHNKDSRVLAYKQKPPMPQEGYQNSLKVLYSQGSVTKKADIVKPVRHISSTPIRILDAPDLMDDYYLNLLSWSASNSLAVALSQTVYLWDASSGGIKELMTLQEDDDYASAVAWMPEGGNHLAIGTNSNSTELWDAASGKKLRNLRGHSSRISSLAWNGHLLTTGSRDTTIMTHDVRIANHVVGVLRNHTQEVCGLSWSPDGSYLASGANDNTLCIYDAASTTSFNGVAKHTLTDHNAAVKALAWSPHERNLLVFAVTSSFISSSVLIFTAGVWRGYS